jgi:hypothetical protein
MALWHNKNNTLHPKFSTMHTARVMIAFILVAGSVAAEWRNEGNKNSQKVKVMDTSKLSNPIVKAAFQAWQQGDSNLWLSYFTADAQLQDDGHPRNFKNFSTQAIGHEYFTSIDIVKDYGHSIFGKFHSDTWGNFKTYFKFHINGNNKIYKLEIGQADY